jgi:Mg-chelatase subunit ChlI
MSKVVFPFSAFVNQDELKLALLLNVINPKIGGVLIKGPKGTGKSSFVYALPDILPKISVVKGCPYNCNPSDPTNMCDECRSKTNLDIEEKPMRVVTLPLGTTEDRLIGSINVEEIISKGIKRLQPGILAMANQNILYIDEINLLPDHITDDILDAAASGWNTVEREGISLTHPARFVLIGSMNPEEGELRPQILDRLALSVDVKRIENENDRAEVVRRNLLFENNPLDYLELVAPEQQALSDSIIKAKTILPKVEIAESLLTAIALSCAKLEVDGMRPDVIITKTALSIAAYERRTAVAEEDVIRAAYLALSHRTRKGGFQSPATRDEIKNTFEQLMAKYRGKLNETFKVNLVKDKKKDFL